MTVQNDLGLIHFMGNKNGKENEERNRSTEELVKREPMKESPKMTKDDFELLKTVGKGSFGKVFQVIE